jgi:hypothetical protein
VVYFKRVKAGVRIKLDPVEAAVLEQVISEQSEVIGEPAGAPSTAEPADDQAWARELGLGDLADLHGSRAPDPEPPTDPVRARLFPDGYRDDADAAQDFRRFTEDDVRAVKAGNAATLISSLPAGGGSVVLDESQVAAWLGGLNDARLALGTALEVDENTQYEIAGLESGSPRAQRLLVYHWLGELQSSLLDEVMGD